MDKVDSAATLGACLKQARKQLALTQEQLALAAGVGVRFVIELEAGKPTVRFEHVLKVMRALGCDLYVTDWQGNKK